MNKLTPLKFQFTVIALIEIAFIVAISLIAFTREFMDEAALLVMMMGMVVIPLTSIALHITHDHLNSTRLKEWVERDGWKLVNRRQTWQWDESWTMFCVICGIATTVGFFPFTR